MQKSIDRLRMFEPPEGYFLAFSGGKDSQCIYHLAKEAGVKFDAHYNITTVDPPELVYFIRDHYHDVICHQPELSMWQLIVKKGMPPTRLMRYCCEVLKEGGGAGRVVVTGVRWAESQKRKSNRAMLELNSYSGKKAKIMLNNDNDEARMMFETCVMKGRHILNPIIDWETADVWEYITSRNLPYCKLYEAGYSRLGCIGCPMSYNQRFELERYPAFKRAYIRAFDKMVQAHGYAMTANRWQNGQMVMDWWIERADKRPEVTDQIYIPLP